MNAVTTADERVLVEVLVPKSLVNAGKSAPPIGESTLNMQAVQARAEAVTTVLEDILRAHPSGDRREK